MFYSVFMASVLSLSSSTAVWTCKELNVDRSYRPICYSIPCRYDLLTALSTVDNCEEETQLTVKSFFISYRCHIDKLSNSRPFCLELCSFGFIYHWPKFAIVLRNIYPNFNQFEQNGVTTSIWESDFDRRVSSFDNVRLLYHWVWIVQIN